jgi:O-antigen ligase
MVKVKTERGTRNTLFHLIALVVCSAAFVALAIFAFSTIRDMQTQTRGVAFGVVNNTTFGVNVALEQYSDDDLRRALALIRAGGFKLMRQHFYWNEIEPRAGELRWDKWDRIVARAREHGLDIIAVIDTTPEWARHAGERDLVNAAPTNVDDYARFVAAFVKRYGDRVRYVQIWDNPNVHPFWGRRNADPIEYTALLRSASIAARAANPSVKILAAGLAPNGELIREHPDYSDVLFLRGMYDADAREHFDIAAVKPYGMWSGADDRRVAMDVFNFSRAILLREEMLARGDADKPVWAVEFGWNALPQNWRGAPSPWGSDSEEIQSMRLADAVTRARSEWSWMPVMIAQTFQPNAPSDDPVWGFALVDEKMQPRAAYSALTRAMAVPAPPASFDFVQFYAMLAGLGMAALTALMIGGRAMWQLPFENAWQAIAARFSALPEIAQFALLALGAIAFYYSPNTVLNFALLALLVFLFALRLDLGLAITIFAIPFYLLPKNLFGGAQFSMVEVLVLVSVVAWGARQATSQKQKGKSIFTLDLTLLTFDFAVVFFVLVGVLSVKVAANFGVAMREFRVIVIEPALLYGLIRASNLARRDLWRLVDAFILSAIAISLIGLYQCFFTDYVIIGEGVRRVLAVYGSPNNLALYLDRALPLVAALALFVDDKRRRAAYALAAIPIALALYLTYSRGAWLGIAVGFAFIGLMSGRRVRIAIVALLIVAALAMIPFLQTERAQSLFQTGTGTGFFRVSVWQSGVAMIRDHPVFGVGLDNFLYEYPKYIQPEAWREPNLSHPHNIVLDFWVRMGILGVAALAWMVSEFYRAGFRQLVRENRALVLSLMAGITAALAHGMIDAAYFYVDLAYIFMLIFGVMAEANKP